MPQAAFGASAMRKSRKQKVGSRNNRHMLSRSDLVSHTNTYDDRDNVQEREFTIHQVQRAHYREQCDSTRDVTERCVGALEQPLGAKTGQNADAYAEQRK